MERIDIFVEAKRKNAEIYSELLKDVKEIILPIEESYVKRIHWLYSIVLKDPYEISRDELIKKLRENGIESRPVFYLLTDMPPYKSDEKFPVASNISNRGISLPSSVDLKIEDIKKIVGVIKNR